MALEPGTRLGHYAIAFLLGKGGMGEVYRARDTTTGDPASESTGQHRINVVLNWTRELLERVPVQSFFRSSFRKSHSGTSEFPNPMDRTNL